MLETGQREEYDFTLTVTVTNLVAPSPSLTTNFARPIAKSVNLLEDFVFVSGVLFVDRESVRDSPVCQDVDRIVC